VTTCIKCITFELLSLNLYEFIRNNDFRGVSFGLIRRFAVQLLTSLKYMRTHGIIHCDLKPENILLKQPNKSLIKVIDLGSSCFQTERIYTYIQSRFYRAPEIMLGIPYTTAIDMWSFGCILAELYSGFPIFPGESEKEQLLLIMEMLGVPPRYMLDMSTRRKLFFDQKGNPIVEANSAGKLHFPSTKTLSQKIKCNDKGFLSLIMRCFEWDPERRITPEEALKHEWILENQSVENSTKNSSRKPNIRSSRVKIPILEEKLGTARKSKRHITAQNINQNVSFNINNTTINAMPENNTIERIVLKKPSLNNQNNNPSDAFYIRLGRKRNTNQAQNVATVNNSLNISNISNSKITLNETIRIPAQKKPVLKIKLAGNIATGIKLKNTMDSDRNTIDNEMNNTMAIAPPPIKQFKIVKFVFSQFLAKSKKIE